ALAARVGGGAFVAGTGGNLAERRRTGEVDSGVRRREVVPLERVLEVEAERGGGPLLDLPFLRGRELRVDKALPVEGVAPDISQPVRLGVTEIAHRLDQTVLRSL